MNDTGYQVLAITYWSKLMEALLAHVLYLNTQSFALRPKRVRYLKIV